tara:strand:+ start:720 stop:845 length:126 start_codon:yes stop_codon:yes gene_type:complete
MPNKKAKERKRNRRKLAIENKTRKRILKKMQKEKRNARETT